MIRAIPYWGKCSGCGMERRVSGGRIIAHQRYSRATGSMVPCPGSGYRPYDAASQDVTSDRAGRPLVAT